MQLFLFAVTSRLDAAGCLCKCNASNGKSVIFCIPTYAVVKDQIRNVYFVNNSAKAM